MLSTELTRDAITLFLNSNLISAYLITTSQPGAVIRGIIDGTMQECASQDSSYDGFLLMETKSKSIGGYHTRTGLAPMGIPFKEFSEKFEQLFEDAKDTYKRNNPAKANKDYSINLIRILPSNVAFRAIGNKLNQQLPSLIATVGNLMVEKLDLMENFQFATSISGEEPKLKLKKIVTAAINQYTSIYTLTKIETSSVLSRDAQLKNIISNKIVDKTLMSKYSSNNLCDLSIAIFKTKKTYETKRLSFETEFQKTIEESIVEAKGKIDQEQLKVLSAMVLSKLEKYGRILSL